MDNTQKVDALSQLLALFKGITALAVHDAHKVNIINAVVAGVEAAGETFLTTGGNKIATVIGGVEAAAQSYESAAA